MTYKVKLTPSGRRAISQKIPTKIAHAAFYFMEFVLTENPQRVSEQLNPPFEKYRSSIIGSYRIIFEIKGDTVYVTNIAYHDDVYRPR